MISFSCATCGMKFNLKEEFAGRTTKCPTCEQSLVVPRPAATMLHVPTGQIKGTPSCLARVHVVATMTLPPPNASSPERKTVSQLLAGHSQTGDRYVVEGEIARGGMGAILRAVDSDIRREVAVKYLLDQDDPRKKLRFIEEAQITGQLEHPNIVPIHELGVDAQDRMFFSMKLVRGRSLAQIVNEKWDSPAEAEKQFPLGRLLTVFVNVCNALAYAHARGVIHRDLKPANIMVGDFGEAYVMDWGLAKVLHTADAVPEPAALGPMPVPASPTVYAAPGLVTHEHATPVARPVSASATAIDSGAGSRSADLPTAIPVAADGTAFSKGSGTVITSRELADDLTQEGSVLGTPVYMPPEQATGAINAIDQRSDVYSLGAILYELLALQAPISKEGHYTDILLRVVQGEIMPPELANRHRARAGKVPAELSAIAMKALSKRPDDRYQSVEELRQDVELFVEGRSVSAKEDTRREQIVKFVKRNRAFSAAAAAAVVLISIIVVWSSWVNYQARRAAEQAQAAYEIEQKEKEERTLQAVPALVKAARQDTEERRFDMALTNVKVALEYDPDNLNARLLHAQLHIVKENFKTALTDLDRYLKHRASDADAQALRRLCGKAKPEEVGNLVHIAQVFSRQQSPGLAEGLLLRHGPSGDAVRQKLLELYRKRIEAAWPGQGPQFTLDKEGRFRFSLSGESDLTPLRDVPLSELTLLNCTNLRDLSPLQGMPLTVLRVDINNGIADLSGLKGLSLKHLTLVSCNGLRDLQALAGMPLTDLTVLHCGGLVNLSGLKGLPLTALFIQGCGGLRDLSALNGMPLTTLQVAGCGEVRDLAPLKGLKLTDLNLSGASVRDLAPLTGMPLVSLSLVNCGLLRDLSPLKDLRLTTLDLSGCTEVRDLSPLAGMPLANLSLVNCGLLTDLSGLKGLKLQRINLHACGRVQDLSPLAGMPLTEIDLRACPIKDVNVLKGMLFTELTLDGCVELTDLSGLKGMPLKVLSLAGCGKLTDLSPLAGLSLTRLNLADCIRITDLSALKGMPLNQLTLNGWVGLPDLKQLKGLTLETLEIEGCTSITDLSPLHGMSLKNLRARGCIGLPDLKQLKGLPLRLLVINDCTTIIDLSPLKGMKLTTLGLSATGVRDLTPLQGMPLTELYLARCPDLRDLTPLAGMKLTLLEFPPQVANGLEGIRKMKTLLTIDGKPAAEFWQQYDASRPKPK